MMTYAVLEDHWSLLPDILLKISMDDDHNRVFFRHNGEICVAALIPREQWTDREIKPSGIEYLIVMPEPKIRDFFDALLREIIMVDEEELDYAIFAVSHPTPAWSSPEKIEEDRETMGLWPRTIEKTQVRVEEICHLAPFALGGVTEEEIDFDTICKKHLGRLNELKTIARDFVKEKGIEEPTVEEWIRIALEEGAR